jgi:hypothetical protein
MIIDECAIKIKGIRRNLQIRGECLEAKPPMEERFVHHKETRCKRSLVQAFGIGDGCEHPYIWTMASMRAELLCHVQPLFFQRFFFLLRRYQNHF